MSIGEITLVILGVIMLLPSLASATRFDQWWIRGFDFPRIQISFLISLTLVASLIYYDFSETLHWVMISLLIFSLGYQIWKILPYTYLGKKMVLRVANNDEAANISILVSNVLTPNKKFQKLIDLVEDRKPDMLLTLESDERWEKELSGLEKEYKYTVKVPLDNLYGMHLYSKLELIDPEVKYLVQEGIPSIHGKVKLRNGKNINFYCLHPMPPSPSEAETSTNRDAELLMLGRDLDGEKNSILVFGDLNDVAWSRTTRLFMEMSCLLDPRRGRGFFNTFHADYRLLRWPLDHVFHSRDFGLIEIARERHVGSDHFPMYIKLKYQPSVSNKHETPEADKEEEQWAEQKIKDAHPLEAHI